MKLATYRDGSRDGQLVVVSRDGTMAHYATGIATRMQQLLDDWNFLSPQLEDLSTTLNHGKARHAFAFEPEKCLAPLPRAYQWADGSAYLSHARRLWQARGEPVPAALEHDPLIYQGSGDDFLGPTQPAVFASADGGIDFEAELVVIAADLGMGSTPTQGLEAIRLLGLANDWTLRQLVSAELDKRLGLVQCKPATAFAPLLVTPDELGAAWDGGRVHLTVSVAWNGQTVGLLETGPEMHFHFGELLAHLAKTRNLRAGCIVGGGTVSNADAARGYGCIAEKRALEAAEGAQAGEAKTGYMRDGDTVRIEVKGRDGMSVFGAIEQPVRVNG
jgi:fumarylacetoacetate (FAA) hydrolase